jgi:uncharacterized protein (DUF58 family)
LTRNGYLFVLAFVLLLAAGSARLWQRFGLSRVDFRRHLSAREVLAGDAIELKVSIDNRKLMPLTWLEWTDEIGIGLEATRAVLSHRTDIRELVNLVSLRPYERVTRRYQVQCRTRGYHAIGPVTLRSGDLFGLSWSERVLSPKDHVLVHPRVRPLQAFGVPPTDPFGDLRLKSRLFPDPTRVVATRPAYAGEALRHVHWRATARQGTLHVKVLESSAAAGLSLFLDLRTSSGLWEGVDVDKQEFLIEAAASVAAEALGRGRRVGLYANGISHLEPLGDCLRVEPGNGPSYLRAITRGLALLRRYPTVDFCQLLRREGARTSWRTTLGVFTHLMDEDLRMTLRALAGQGRAVVLFLPQSVAAVDLPPGVVVRSLSDAA